MKRILGLDLGEKTIGVAVCDPMRIFAQGLTTIWRSSRKKDFAAIGNLIETYDVDTIVLGLPKNMNDTIGPQSEKALAFGEKLERKFQVQVKYIDERLTTVQAEQVLIRGGVRRENRKQFVDKLAASLILQTYLDQQKKEENL